MTSDMFHILGLLSVLVCIICTSIISRTVTGFGVTFVCILAGCSALTFTNQVI